MTLKVKVNDPQYQPRESQDCEFGYCSSNSLQVIRQLRKFPRILSQNDQKDLKGQGQ